MSHPPGGTGGKQTSAAADVRGADGVEKQREREQREGDHRRPLPDQGMSHFASSGCGCGCGAKCRGAVRIAAAMRVTVAMTMRTSPMLMIACSGGTGMVSPKAIRWLPGAAATFFGVARPGAIWAVRAAAGR